MSRNTVRRIGEYWPGDPAADLVDKLYWRAKNRYVALRGKSSAGKSAALNVLFGKRLLPSTDGQTTGSITEVRPVADAGAEPRVHLVSPLRLQARLDALHSRHPSAFPDYRVAADEVMRVLGTCGRAMGGTVSEQAWDDMGFSLSMGSVGPHNVVIDRITYPVAVEKEHPMRWAADQGVSFLDLPGDATGEVFNEILLEEAETAYPPGLTLRFWRATHTDRPSLGAGDLLVVTFLDDPEASPSSNYVKTIRGTLQDHFQAPHVLSVAADAPPTLDLGLRFGAPVALACLQDWQTWLQAEPQSDDETYQRLLRGVGRSLTDGGSTALLDAVHRHLADAPDPTTESDDVRALARETVRALTVLRDGLQKPLSRVEQRTQDKMNDEQRRQARRREIERTVRRCVYGSEDSIWADLAAAAEATQPEQAGTLVDKLHEGLVVVEQEAAQATLGQDLSEPRLAKITRPLVQELCARVTAQDRDADAASWADVARVRWEVSSLLADLLFAAARAPEAVPLAPVAAATERSQSTDADYRLRAGPLAKCLTWAEHLAS